MSTESTTTSHLSHLQMLASQAPDFESSCSSEEEEDDNPILSIPLTQAPNSSHRSSSPTPHLPLLERKEENLDSQEARTTFPFSSSMLSSSSSSDDADNEEEQEAHTDSILTQTTAPPTTDSSVEKEGIPPSNDEDMPDSQMDVDDAMTREDPPPPPPPENQNEEPSPDESDMDTDADMRDEENLPNTTEENKRDQDDSQHSSSDDNDDDHMNSPPPIKKKKKKNKPHHRSSKRNISPSPKRAKSPSTSSTRTQKKKKERSTSPSPPPVKSERKSKLPKSSSSLKDSSMKPQKSIDKKHTTSHSSRRPTPLPKRTIPGDSACKTEFIESKYDFYPASTKAMTVFVKQTIQENLGLSVRVSSGAITLLQRYASKYVNELVTDSVTVLEQMDKKRVTLLPNEIKTVVRLKNNV